MKILGTCCLYVRANNSGKLTLRDKEKETVFDQSKEWYAPIFSLALTKFKMVHCAIATRTQLTWHSSPSDLSAHSSTNGSEPSPPALPLSHSRPIGIECQCTQTPSIRNRIEMPKKSNQLPICVLKANGVRCSCTNACMRMLIWMGVVKAHKIATRK